MISIDPPGAAGTNSPGRACPLRVIEFANTESTRFNRLDRRKVYTVDEHEPNHWRECKSSNQKATGRYAPSLALSVDIRAGITPEALRL